MAYGYRFLESQPIESILSHYNQKYAHAPMLSSWVPYTSLLYGPEILKRGAISRPFSMISEKLSIKFQHLEKCWAHDGYSTPIHGLMNEFWDKPTWFISMGGIWGSVIEVWLLECKMCPRVSFLHVQALSVECNRLIIARVQQKHPTGSLILSCLL